MQGKESLLHSWVPSLDVLGPISPTQSDGAGNAFRSVGGLLCIGLGDINDSSMPCAILIGKTTILMVV